MKKAAPWLVWLLVCGPAIAQIVLLAIAIAGRFGYPYDLEWMEGGMLQHAQRISDGEGIYGPPSVDFIPYLYTPLYPGLLAMLGSMFELGYKLGRAISILSLLGIAGVAFAILRGATRGAPAVVRAAGVAGTIYAIGLFAAGYPLVEGWYDLVRGDTLFLFMITGGLALTHSTVRETRGWGSWADHARTGGAAAVLALAFFCKQTGVLFVLAGGAIVLACNWRRIFAYGGVAALVGGGGTALLSRSTGKWFWTYAYEIHQAHDWNKDRYFQSFETLAKHLPAVTILLQVTLVLVLATWAVRKRLPREARTFLVWFFLYLVSLQIGAIGWGTEFAHFNAYMPAMLHGAIAAGCALPAVATCVALLVGGEPEAAKSSVEPHWDAQSSDRTVPITTTAAAPAMAALRRGTIAGQIVAGLCVVGLGVQCIASWWKPAKYIPTESDRRAGDALIAHIKSIPGEVWVPSHPWYAHLAGKRMFTHRMGVTDVTARKPRPINGLDEALRGRVFAAIVMDNKDVARMKDHSSPGWPPRGFDQMYQMEDSLPKSERPRVYTGAETRPDSVWVPIGPPAMPEGARAVFDFETPGWGKGWAKAGGDAWGNGSVDARLPDQGLVRRNGGRRWISSMHGGDGATGTAISPPFTIDGSTLYMRLGGGTDAGLRVEVWSGGMMMRRIRPPEPASERFRDVTVDVSGLERAQVELHMVDEATGAWGHLNVDEVWLLP